MQPILAILMWIGRAAGFEVVYEITGAPNQFTSLTKPLSFRDALVRAILTFLAGIVAGYVLLLCFPTTFRAKSGVREYQQELAEIRLKAEAGDAGSEFILGRQFEFGTGVTKDPVEAVKWYRKAAEQGDADAQANLGNCYATGQGVDQNQVEAAKWWRKAAEQNHVGAQFNLGHCYANGEGLTKDQTEAVKWWRKAAEQSHVKEQFNLDLSYANGEGVAKDDIAA